ncbi:carboxylesterase family protein [Kocuria sp. LUK]|uniref:carboxylesterase family protein n=1 Tax=Kocuria sp. LUK TaxID=2897828 RepID=UPI001E4C70F9|nr:carboxylesterase family protein [Kocuria sp. LUK]MCD1144974.1 carboxylesterase family protein [Kocuria sp. LUK]
MDASPTAARPRFDPPCGPVRGFADGAVLRATGIPYARAGRFEAPVPAPDHAEVLDATAPSPACPQQPSPFLDRMLGPVLGGLPTDEDCQRLSVTLPRTTPPEHGFPVLVWVHGGSYAAGAGDSPGLDPARLVAEQDVVVVAVTYRLGLFGCLGDGGERPANLALLDLLAALRWVRRNIAAFGGNPGCVTAFGQSAGGDAVAHLLAAGGQELVERVILQSAPLGIRTGRAPMTAAMNAAAGRVDRTSGTEEVLAEEAGVVAAATGLGLRRFMPFGTQYGHCPLPAEEEVTAAWDAAAPGVDVLIGHTTHEARFFYPVQPLAGRAVRVPVLGPLLDRALNAVVTRSVYAAAGTAFAARHARAGGRAWRYVLTWGPDNAWGSTHTVDLPLLLGDERTWAGAELLRGTEWSRVEEAGRALRAVWADFARGDGLPERGGIPGVLRWRRVRPRRTRRRTPVLQRSPRRRSDLGRTPSPVP